MALIGDSIGQPARQAASPHHGQAGNSFTQSRQAEPSGIFGFFELTYLFLAAVLVTDIVDLVFIGRLAQSVVFDPPAAKQHTTLALLIFAPAIASSLASGYLTSGAACFRTLSWAALARCVLIACFVWTTKFGDFSRWQALVLIAMFSMLSAYALVPRLAWIIDRRKASFATAFQLIFFALALLSGISLSNQNISTPILFQWALVGSAMASLAFKVFPQHQNITTTFKTGRRHIPFLIVTKSYTMLAGLSIWSCLALASFQQYPDGENSLVNLCAISLAGIFVGTCLPLLKTQMDVLLVYALRILSALVAVVFGFFGSNSSPQTFLFVYTTLWSASYMCDFKLPKRKFISFRDSHHKSIKLDHSIAWSQTIVFTTILLVCIATSIGIDTISGAQQIRKFALTGGIISLLSAVFLSRSLAKRFGLT